MTLVGHDIGGMVAYAALRAFPDLARVVIMDVPIPARGGREEQAGAYASPAAPTAGFDWYRAFDREGPATRPAAVGPPTAAPLLYQDGVTLELIQLAAPEHRWVEGRKP